MKKIVVMLLFISTVLFSGSKIDQYKFPYTTNMSEVTELAVKNNMPIIMFAMGIKANNSFLIEMLSDTKIIETLKKDFQVILKQKHELVKELEQFNVSNMPTVWILSSSGVPIYAPIEIGFSNAAAFLDFLRTILTNTPQKVSLVDKHYEVTCKDGRQNYFSKDASNNWLGSLAMTNEAKGKQKKVDKMYSILPIDVIAAKYCSPEHITLFELEKDLLVGKEHLTFGTGKEVLYVFTDPECPYCVRFDRKMRTLGHKYTFKVFIYPLRINKRVIKKLEWLLSAPSNEKIVERLLALTNDSQEYSGVTIDKEDKKRVYAMIKSSMSLGKAMSLRGTPAVYNKDLEMINWSTLEP